MVLEIQPKSLLITGMSPQKHKHIIYRSKKSGLLTYLMRIDELKKIFSGNCHFK